MTGARRRSGWCRAPRACLRAGRRCARRQPYGSRPARHRDHLDIIGAAAAHPAVGDSDDRDTPPRGLGDCAPSGMVHRQHADVVAAVVEDRQFCLTHHADRPARLFEAPMLGDVEELCQPRILVSAECGIDRVIGDDARFLLVIADAAHRGLGMLAGFADTQAHSIGRHSLQLPRMWRIGTTFPRPAARTYSAASRATGSGHQRRIGLRAAAVSSRRRRGVSRGAP
jgi:hypothetical protein